MTKFLIYKNGLVSLTSPVYVSSMLTVMIH